ncbi:myeloid cell surface antigen CD33-like isoform X1, partial [Clarias magur]
KKDDAPEDNTVKAGAQTKVKSTPQPKEEVLKQEEVAYASVCGKDLNNGLSGDGTLKQGDSLNLTCDVNCTHSSSQFVWSKNNEQFNTSGPVLHFPALTVRDSGSYTCTWKTNETSGSKTISLQVEGENQQTVWIIVSVTVAIILILVTGAVIYNR